MDKKVIVQIICIIVGVFGVIAGIVALVTCHSFVGFIRAAYAILFCLILILCEIYIFGFFKYFGFLLKNGGKALMYLFVGALLFGRSGFPLFCGILYWALAVVFAIMGFMVPYMPPPLLQGGYKGSAPNVSIDSSEIYQNNQTGFGSADSMLNQGFSKEIE